MFFSLRDLLSDKCDGKRKKGVVMECHIQPDWLLIWVQNENELTLTLTDTGTHSDLF